MESSIQRGTVILLKFCWSLLIALDYRCEAALKGCFPQNMWRFLNVKRLVKFSTGNTALFSVDIENTLDRVDKVFKNFNHSKQSCWLKQYESSPWQYVSAWKGVQIWWTSIQPIFIAEKCTDAIINAKI